MLVFGWLSLTVLSLIVMVLRVVVVAMVVLVVLVYYFGVWCSAVGFLAVRRSAVLVHICDLKCFMVPNMLWGLLLLFLETLVAVL